MDTATAQPADQAPLIEYEPGRHDGRLHTAICELMEAGKSLTELSVEQIANQAGLSRATFYLHYKDKAALVEQLGRSVALDILDATTHWQKYAHLGYFADVRATMKQVIDRYEQHYVIVDLMSELSMYDTRIAEIYRFLLDVIISHIDNAISRAQKNGIAHDSLNPMLASFIVHGTERQMYYYGAKRGNPRKPGLVDVISEVTWHMVYDPAKVPPKEEVPPHLQAQ